MQLTQLIYLALFSFTSLYVSQNPGIAGKWSMHKVIQEEQEVTEEHDPFNERYIILYSDSTFESSGRPFGENTGKYIYNNEKQTLFIDSDTGPEDDSYWNVQLKGDTMVWTGYGTEWAEDFQIIHIRNPI